MPDFILKRSRGRGKEACGLCGKPMGLLGSFDVYLNDGRAGVRSVA